LAMPAHSPVPGAAPAGGSIVAALLLPQDRIPREPLSAWAGRLRQNVERFRRSARTPVQLSREGSAAGNNAALIAALRGDAEGAWAACERQMWWQARLSRRARVPAIAARCVQPWVNLARLEALAGDWQGAVTRLERLRPLGKSGAIALQPLRRDGTGCSQITGSGDDDFPAVLDNMYVIDTLRALLQNRRWDEVLHFADAVRRRFRPGLGLWAMEAQVVAACRAGDHDRARAVACEALERPDVTAWRRVVFRMRLAEVEACAGDAAGAAAALAPLARGVRRLSAEARAQLQPLYVLARLAGACLECGMAEDAAAIAGGVYEGARAAGDQVFQVEALRVLVRAAPDAGRAGWAETLAALQGETEYRQYRAPGAPPADSVVIDALLAELAEVYAA
ncbi:MAG TPA: hypothetical protein VFR37_10065, partial [Longimicrobium sp.]|nr:hypothetical protein [Longimicrobium sp.]